MSMKRSIDEIVRVSELPAEDQNRILDFACHLLAQPCEIDVSSFLRAVGLGADLPVKHRSRLDKLHRSESMIEKQPVAAMLVADIAGSFQEKNRHEQLKRLLLKAAIRFPDKANAIGDACRRIRLAEKENTSWLFDLIRDHSDSLGAIVSCLESAEDEIEQEPDTKESQEKLRRCAELRRPLEWLYNDRARVRSGGRRAKAPVESEGMTNDPFGDDLGDVDLSGRLLQATSGTDKDRADHEPLASQRYFDLGLQDSKSYGSYQAKQRRDARHASDEMRMRAVYAPCGWPSLTDNEVGLTLRECFSAVDESHSIASAMIVLSIFLGRKPTTLLSLPIRRHHLKDGDSAYWHVTGKTVRLVFELPMPAFAGTDFAQQVRQASRTRIELAIPKSIEPILRDLAKLALEYRQPGSQLSIEVSGRISQLNHDHVLRLNEPRLATYMLTRLASDGFDEVIVRRLRGEPLSRNVPQHYDGCPSVLTYETFTQHCRKLGQLAKHPVELGEMPPRSTAMGSQLQVERGFLKKYFALWSEHLAVLRDSYQEPIEFHNDYVLGTHAILAVATGHRPVTRMFESIHDYDPVSRELFIADKNSRHGADCRCIALPETAAQQLDLYIEHLRVLRAKAGHSIAAVRAAKRALSGDGPLLFRIRQIENARDIVEHFDPGKVKDWLADKWPIDHRWSRHFFCTETRSQHLSFEAINSSLGHDGLGPANFNPFSGMSYTKLKDFARQYDVRLIKLGVRPIQGLIL